MSKYAQTKKEKKNLAKFLRKFYSKNQTASDRKYFQAYNVFNAIKLAVDFSIIQEASHIAMTDSRQVDFSQKNPALFIFFSKWQNKK